MPSDNSEVMIPKADVLRIIDLHTAKNIFPPTDYVPSREYQAMIKEIESLG